MLQRKKEHCCSAQRCNHVIPGCGGSADGGGSRSSNSQNRETETFCLLEKSEVDRAYIIASQAAATVKGSVSGDGGNSNCSSSSSSGGHSLVTSRPRQASQADLS